MRNGISTPSCLRLSPFVLLTNIWAGRVGRSPPFYALWLILSAQPHWVSPLRRRDAYKEALSAGTLPHRPLP